MMAPPLGRRGTAYLMPKKVPPSNKPMDRLKPSTETAAIGPPSPPAPALLTTQSSEPAEAFHDERHQRFGVGGTGRIGRVKRRVWAERFFKRFSFFKGAAAEHHAGAFLDKPSDDGFADAPGAPGNDGDQMLKPKPG